MEDFLEGFHIVRGKADTIADARDLSGKNTVLVVIVDTGRVTLLRHGVRHGLIPILSRNERAAGT